METFSVEDKRQCWEKLQHFNNIKPKLWREDKNENLVANIKKGHGDVTLVYTGDNPDVTFTLGNCKMLSGATFCEREQTKFEQNENIILL